MALFKPKERIDKMIDLTPRHLQSIDVNTLLLDIDNTMTTHNNPEPADGVVEWINRMKAAGVQMMVVSNNNGERVRQFSELLGLEFEGSAKKPLPVGFRRACRRMGVKPKQTAVIGDQLFTDMMGGNLLGAYTILTVPYLLESSAPFRFKRALERVVMAFWRDERRRLPLWGKQDSVRRGAVNALSRRKSNPPKS